MAYRMANRPQACADSMLSTQVLRQNAIVVLNQRLVPGRYRVVSFHQCSIEHKLLDLSLERQDDFAYALGVVRGRDEEPRAAGGLGFVPPPVSSSSGSKRPVEPVSSLSQGALRG